MCFRGGGQRSMVKDHTFTFFFLDPSLRGVVCHLAPNQGIDLQKGALKAEPMKWA